MTARHNTQITAAIAAARTDPDRWQPAVGGPQSRRARSQAHRRARAQVTELTEAVDLSHWPEGTLIVRREPLHPGAQRTCSTRWRYWGFLTDAVGDPARLDADMPTPKWKTPSRGSRTPGSTRCRFAPAANAAWTALCVISLALVSWFQALRLTGALAKAAPKRLRWQLWHTPVRVVRTARRTTARLPDHHPGTPALLAAAAHT